MRYKGYVKDCKRIASTYKSTIDSIIAKMQMDIAETEKAITQYDGVWTDGYKDAYRKNHNNTEGLKQLVKLEQAKATEKLNNIFTALDAEIKNYFVGTARSNFVSTLMGYTNLGITLSNNEFKALAESVTTYSEARMVAQLADNYVKNNSNFFDNDILNRILDPISVPDFDTTMKLFSEFKATANFLISDYCGIDGSGHSLIESAGDVAFAVNADTFLRSRAMDDFCQVLETCNNVLPDKIKNKLTKEETALIDAAIPDYEKYPHLACKQACEIAENDYHMAELFSLDERYCKAVEGVLDEE